ncbi:MAG: hypothetical protein FWF53_06870 [Candidatus Azobacteroides sp.]|nr:hypothetical protein [Candidatus Azobacteroides sp.]
MEKRYIKVTEKGRPSFIVPDSNENFYKNRGAKIEEASKEEIEKCFPEEAVKSASGSIPFVASETAIAELEAEKTAHGETKKRLEAEILAHNETKQKLETVNAILQIKKEESEKANAESEKPQKKIRI